MFNVARIVMILIEVLHEKSSEVTRIEQEFHAANKRCINVINKIKKVKIKQVHYN